MDPGSVLKLGTERIGTSDMRENPEMQSSQTAGTGFRVRLKVAVGVGAVLVTSIVASSFAAAAVPRGAMAASHPARVGSSRNALVSLTAASSRQGTRASVVVSKAPTPLWPHWGVPTRPLVATSKAPTPLWPHWGRPEGVTRLQEG